MRWVSYPVYSALLMIGLHPAKSRTLGPLALPRDAQGYNHFWAFFRGVFEGDGTITLQPTTGTPREIAIISGSEPFLVWLQKELYKRGIYKSRIINANKRRVGARKLVISANYTHRITQRIYGHYEQRFGGMGHPEKERRCRSRRPEIEARPWIAKMRLTGPKIIWAFDRCYDELGRWPTRTEYQRLRQEIKPTLEDPRDFPDWGPIYKRFGSWAKAVEFMERKRTSGAQLAVKSGMLLTDPVAA